MSRHRAFGLVVCVLCWGLVAFVSPAQAAGSGASNDDICVDFGPGIGTYCFSNMTGWQFLTGLDIETCARADLDANGVDELICSFTGVGIYIYDNFTSWSFITGLVAEEIASGDLDCDGLDDVVFDFGSGVGVWAYLNDSSWVLLTGLDPQRMLLLNFDEGCESDVLFEFGPGIGVWGLRSHGSPGGGGLNPDWAFLTGLPVSDWVRADLDCRGQHDAVIDFGPGVGVYRVTYGFNPQTFQFLTFSQITGLETSSLSAADLNGNCRDDLAFNFPGGGFWIQLDSSDWSSPTGLNVEQCVAADFDGNERDELYLDLGPSGMYSYGLDDGFSYLTGFDPLGMLATSFDGRSCRELFFCGYFIEAHACFEQELQAGGTDATRLFLSLTRMLDVVGSREAGPDIGAFTDSLQEMFDQFGATSVGADIFSGDLLFPDALPTDSPTAGDVQEFLRTVFIPAVEASIADLDVIAPSFTLFPTTGEQVCLGGSLPGAVEIDYADVRLLRAVMQALKGQMLLWLQGFDLDIDIDDLSATLVPIQLQATILDPHTNLFTLATTGAADLAAAKAAFLGAIADYYTASNQIRNVEVDPQDDDVVTVAPEDLLDEMDIRGLLGQIHCSLLGMVLDSFDDNGPTCRPQGKVDPPMIGQDPVDLSAFFDTPEDLRSQLPPFLWDADCETDYIDTTAMSPFPDPSFGGLLLGEDQESLKEFFAAPEVEAYIFGSVIFPDIVVTNGAQPVVVFGLVELHGAPFAPPVTVTDVRMASGFQFQIDGIQTPVKLCEGDVTSFDLTFTPPKPAVYNDTIIVETDAGDFMFPVVGCTFGFEGCLPQLP